MRYPTLAVNQIGRRSDGAMVIRVSPLGRRAQRALEKKQHVEEMDLEKVWQGNISEREQKEAVKQNTQKLVGTKVTDEVDYSDDDEVDHKETRQARRRRLRKMLKAATKRK